jgi:hypothetical protein
MKSAEFIFLIIVVAAINVTAARASQSECLGLADGSGSTADDASNRQWLATQLTNLVAAHTRIAPDIPLVVAVYDDQVRVLGSTTPAEVGVPVISGTDIPTIVDQSLRSKHWTDPLAALNFAASRADVACAYVVTDGTIDVPPGSPPDYFNRMSMVADQLAKQGVRVVIVARSDAAQGVWRDVAARTGGALLIDPGTDALAVALSAVVPAGATASPTASPSAPATFAAASALASTSPPAAGQQRSASIVAWIIVGVVVLVVAPIVTALILVIWIAVRRRPHLTGFLEIQSLHDRLGEECGMEIDLSKFGRRACVGSAGDIRVTGDGILPRHAEIVAQPTESGVRIVLRCLGGDLWIERGHVRTRLTRSTIWRPCDGDVFIFGEHRFLYTDLADGGDIDDEGNTEARRALQWLTQ